LMSFIRSLYLKENFSEEAGDAQLAAAGWSAARFRHR
jgi:hypothetical protein